MLDLGLLRLSSDAVVTGERLRLGSRTFKGMPEVMNLGQAVVGMTCC